MNPALALASILTLCASAAQLELPSTPLMLGAECLPRAFMPDGSTVIHWCGDRLELTPLSTGEPSASLSLGEDHAFAHVLVSPDGSRIAAAASTMRDQRVWDLFVFDREGAVVLKDERFAKVEAHTADGVETLVNKLRKKADIKGGKSFALMSAGKGGAAARSFQASNGMTLSWGGSRNSGSCSLQIERDGRTLRNERLRMSGPAHNASESDMEDMVMAEQRKSKLIGGMDDCQGIAASEDGKTVVFGRMSYRTEVSEKAIADVARKQEAESALRDGWLAAKGQAYGKAVEAFSRALELYPGIYRAHLLRGLAYLKLEMGEEAVTDLRAAIERRDGPDEDLRVALARAEVTAKFSARLKMFPHDPVALRERALFRATEQDFAGCARDLRTAEGVGAKLSAQETTLRDQCAEEVARRERARIDSEQAALKERFDRELDEKLANRTPGWWASADFAGVARGILQGSGSGSSGSSAGGRGYSPAPRNSSGANVYRGASGSSAGGPDPYTALVNKRIEQKLWDMNNPANKR